MSMSIVKGSLGQLAAEINEAHAQGLAGYRTSLLHAMAVGDLLLEAKARVGHGDWLTWVDDSLEFDRRTAQRYAQLAEGREQIEVKIADDSNATSVSHLTMGEALKLVQTPRRPSREQVRGAFAFTPSDDDGDVVDGEVVDDAAPASGVSLAALPVPPRPALTVVPVLDRKRYDKVYGAYHELGDVLDFPAGLSAFALGERLEDGILLARRIGELLRQMHEAL